MQPISTLVTVLCGLALPGGFYSCSVEQNLSGVSHPEAVALDDDTQVVSHLKHSWSEGGHPLFADGLTQFVEVSKERLTWGNRRKLDQVITDLFPSISRAGVMPGWIPMALRSRTAPASYPRRVDRLNLRMLGETEFEAERYSVPCSSSAIGN